MTREEAIKNIKEHCYFANLIPQAKEALDMAIKVLEQECVQIPKDATNGDVIKAVFPNESFFNDIFLEVMHYGNYQQIVSDWWNAPYNTRK